MYAWCKKTVFKDGVVNFIGSYQPMHMLRLIIVFVLIFYATGKISHFLVSVAEEILFKTNTGELHIWSDLKKKKNTGLSYIWI